MGQHVEELVTLSKTLATAQRPSCRITPVSRRGAVIVLVHNQKTYLQECLGALRRVLPEDVLIIVVDNGSAENLAAYFKGLYRDLHCLRASSNLGYAGGNNLGALYAISSGAQLLYFLNDDTIPESRFWEDCEHWVKQAKASIVGSVILKQSRPGYMQEAGARYFRSSIEPSYRGVNELYGSHIAGYYRCDAVCGAGFMITAAAFEALGGFDKRFFMYFEETDLCLRARRSGHEVGVAGDSLVVHHGGASLSHRSSSVAYYVIRNRIWLTRRHLSTHAGYRRFLLTYVPRRVLRSSARLLLQGDLAGILTVIRGYVDGIMRYPGDAPPSESDKAKVPSCDSSPHTIVGGQGA
jgi:GT2 family glycosyltransferase